MLIWCLVIIVLQYFVASMLWITHSCCCLVGTPSGALASYSSGGGYSSSLSLSQGGGTVFPFMNSWKVLSCLMYCCGAICDVPEFTRAADLCWKPYLGIKHIMDVSILYIHMGTLFYILWLWWALLLVSCLLIISFDFYSTGVEPGGLFSLFTAADMCINWLNSNLQFHFLVINSQWFTA